MKLLDHILRGKDFKDIKIKYLCTWIEHFRLKGYKSNLFQAYDKNGRETKTNHPIITKIEPNNKEGSEKVSS